MEWSRPTSDAEAYTRASGRWHDNSIRKLLQQQRRIAILRYIVRTKCGLYYGLGAHLARMFDVSRKTICLDLQAIFGRLDFGGGRLKEISRYRPENRAD